MKLVKLALVLTAVSMLAQVGCSGRKNSEGKWEGTYEEPGGKQTVEIKPEHRATVIITGQEPSETTWEVIADDKISVEGQCFYRTSDGNLRHTGGNVWTKK